MLKSMRKSKNRYFYHIFVFPGDAPWGNHAKCCMDGYKENSMLTNCLAACTHLSSTVSQLFELQLQKIAVLTYRSLHFCFRWRPPCDYHAICSIDEKTIQCLPNPLQHVPIYLQQFLSYTMLKSMRKSKNRYFTTVLFPLGTPLAQSR